MDKVNFKKWKKNIMITTVRDVIQQQNWGKKNFFGGGLYLQHIEVPGLGAESEPHLPACAIAPATPDPSCILNLMHEVNVHPHGYNAGFLTR